MLNLRALNIQHLAFNISNYLFCAPPPDPCSSVASYRETCRKSSSTGVERPKIVTMTFSVLRSRFTSSTTPVKFVKGPSIMCTLYSCSLTCLGLGYSFVLTPTVVHVY